MSKKIKKPPIGLIPRFIWLERRLKEIQSAQKRYVDADMDYPDEWDDELNDIILELQNRQQTITKS